MNLTFTILISFLPRLGKVPLRSTFPKTWKQGASPSGWTSIRNNSSNTFNYWRYKNEFVANNSTSNINLYTPNPSFKCFTSNNGSFAQQPNVTYVQICSDVSSVTDRIYFPTPLIKVDDTFKPDLTNSKGKSVVLSQGTDFVIPNLTNNVTIEAQLYSITGAKFNIPLERNNTETLFGTKSLSTGVYLLLVNTDNKVETLRIIVQ